MASNMIMGGNHTIGSYISDFNAEDITHDALFLKQVITSGDKKMIVTFSNLVTKYRTELASVRTKVSLSNTEYMKYRYNPKLLSYDLYGTTELWFLILEANELHSAIEFDMRTIHLYRQSIYSKIARILNIESIPKAVNEAEIEAALKE